MTSGAHYEQAFEQFARQLPAAQRELRRARLQQFLDAGFPGKKLEDWRYTDLASLGERSFSLANQADCDLRPLYLPKTDRLVYVNGILDRSQSTADELSADVAAEPAQQDSIAALNAAFALPGLDLRLGRNAGIARVLHVIVASTASAGASMSHQRHRIELGELARAHVIFEFRGGGDSLLTQTLDIRLGAGAKLRLYRLQHDAAATNLLTRIDAHLDRDSRLEAVCIDGGSGLARHDFNIDIAGPGAEAQLDGLYLPAAGAHVDNHTRIVHSSPHGRSRERFKGIVDARARAVFNGKVVVRPGAQKTDSEQHVANLLLSPRAEVDAKPELEIYADDVKCAHGATVGQLDAKALDYLRIRGIDADSARALLLRAFGAEILDLLTLPSLRQRVGTELKLPVEDGLAAELDA